MTAPKLTALKKRIESFQAAATKQLEGLFSKVDTVLKGRLDKLAVQFKQSQPEFYNEYQAARRIVNISGSRSGRDASVVSAPNTAPETKAA